MKKILPHSILWSVRQISDIGPHKNRHRLSFLFVAWWLIASSVPPKTLQRPAPLVWLMQVIQRLSIQLEWPLCCGLCFQLSPNFAYSMLQSGGQMRHVRRSSFLVGAAGCWLRLALIPALALAFDLALGLSLRDATFQSAKRHAMWG